MRNKEFVFVAAAAAALCVACTDSSGPSMPPHNGLPALVVSPPVSGAAAASGRTARAGIGGTTAYVSLPPASVPDGIGAALRNGRAGSVITTQVFDGGFDPIPIAANVGDTIFVQISRSSTNATVNGFEVVVAGRSPRVVRTAPPAGKKDVPLNEVIVIVFSAPIDSTTLDTNSVKLWQGSTRVSGTVRFADSAHVRAEYHPAGLLLGLTEYQLDLSRAIRDLNGTPLDSALTVPFTTGVTTPADNLVFSSVTVGSFHACGVTTTGAAYCWGADFAGQLGTDSVLDQITTPVAVGGGLKFASLSASWEYTCGVTTSGPTYCWGGDRFGADSLGEFTPGPVLVGGGIAFANVSAGFVTACGVTTSGAAYCWGSGHYGELGSGPGATTVTTPTPVSGGLTFAQVSAGGSHMCGVTTGAAAYCWGQNSAGELGTGSSTGPEVCHNNDTVPCSTVPVAVAGGLTFANVSAGEYSSCGVTTNGVAYCWGNDRSGILGTGSGAGVMQCAGSNLDWDLGGPVTCGVVPIAVGGPGLASVSVSSQDLQACGLESNGAAYCWGEFGPAAVPGGLTFVSLSNGMSSTCAVTAAGVAYCWGANQAGQLGDGTTTPSRVPVKVAGQP